MAGRQRLDTLLMERGLAESRTRAQALIMAGEVKVDGAVIRRAGHPVAATAVITVATPPRYVSRGGEKLAHALAAFAADPSQLVCADIGASTGGFTDCLLQHGAARVYAIDVGYGQLHWSLRQDPRVVPIERTNIRYLESLPEPVALATIDVSFISLKLVLPTASRLLSPDGRVIALVKPQFEAGRDEVGKGGVVRDRATHRAVLLKIVTTAPASGLIVQALTPSPLRGPAGNVEFLAMLTGSIAPNDGEALDTEALIERCLSQVA